MIPRMRVSDFFASSDSSCMNGDAARRSSIGHRLRRGDRCSVVFDALVAFAPDLTHGLGHLLMTELGLDLFEPFAGDLELPLHRLGSLLGGDQLLGLTGEAFLGHPKDVVEVRTALCVGDLQGSACLDLLETPVEIGVLLRRGLQVGRQPLRGDVGLLLAAFELTRGAHPACVRARSRPGVGRPWSPIRLARS